MSKCLHRHFAYSVRKEWAWQSERVTKWETSGRWFAESRDTKTVSAEKHFIFIFSGSREHKHPTFKCTDYNIDGNSQSQKVLWKAFFILFELDISKTILKIREIDNRFLLKTSAKKLIEIQKFSFSSQNLKEASWRGPPLLMVTLVEVRWRGEWSNRTTSVAWELAPNHPPTK